MNKTHTLILTILFSISAMSFAQSPWPTPGKTNPGTPNTGKGTPWGKGFGGTYTVTSDELVIDAPGPVVLMRNAISPKGKLKISKKYEYATKVCTSYAYRQVCGNDGFKCGYDQMQQCYQGPQGMQCRPYQRARYCCWSDRQCVRTDLQTRYKSRNLVIDFRKANELWGGEEESFEVSETKQKGIGVTFHVKPLQTKTPYTIKRKKRFIFFGKSNKFKAIPKKAK